MSVIPVGERSADPSGVETYDSGDDWEIGVGDLIIDLDADLEKDRQKLEMNRLGSAKGSTKEYEGMGSACANAATSAAASDGLAFASAQPSVPQGSGGAREGGRGKVKRSKTPRDASKSASPSAPYGAPETCAGASQDAQGRSVEALATMNPAPGQAVGGARASGEQCARGKEEKSGRTQSRSAKRERDGGSRAKRERQDAAHASWQLGNVYAPGSKGSPCGSGDGGGAGDTAKNGVDCGVMDSAGVGKRSDDDTAAAPAKRPKADKADSMFTVPVSLPPASQAPTPYVHLYPPISSPSEQLLVRTRSIGTNTREVGNGTDPALLGPCEPGTTVNLEGIVWHETEEGVLVVNVTWRKRTYVGTLLDCTKHDWAPPRFCESPSSDFEMRGGRGRGKRMRLAIPSLPDIEPGFSKVRGLPHKNRGGSVHGKGRRASLNLIGSCRIPPFFTVEEIKSTSMISGKRKNKPPADLDLNLVSEDVKSGKRIRAKSRSAPSTPQGKSDPSFIDQGCSSPTLIDCPHPNCNKKYKHINGLRYHQTHAHLDLDRKLDFEVEGEARISDCEESLSNITLDCPESTESPVKTSSLFKLTTLGMPRNRKVPLNNDHAPATNAKVRRNSGTKEGLDDLSNLPIISNMTVLLENCLVTDRSSSTEMPKLEAEGLIDKKGMCDKSKKANGKVDKCSSKSKITRPIAPAPPPPKLIAISTATFTSNTAGTIPHQTSPPAVVGHIANKSPLLKPIRPKSSSGEPNLVNSTLVTGKDNRRKEKRRFKDRDCKEGRSPKSEHKLLKTDLAKGMGKEFPVSLLKEHLSKQDSTNGMSESQESRMASIRAEADKVYTFTDNAPSPSIGTSSRLDGGTLSNGDGNTTKTNSPAYSDISDAADDGGGDSRSEGTRTKGSLASDASSNKDSHTKGFQTTATQEAMGKEAQSPYYHGYDPYYLSGYLQSGQPNNSFSNVSSLNDASPRKEDVKEDGVEKESDEYVEGKKNDVVNSSSQSQLQLAMMQTQTALAQSLYYGQYTRGLYVDQKLLMLSNTYRPPYEKFYDEPQFGEQKATQLNQEAEAKEQSKEETNPKMVSSSVASKATDSVKSCCPKPGLTEELGEKHIPVSQHQQGKPALVSEMNSQHNAKDGAEMKLAMDSVKQTALDQKLSFTHDPEAHSWYHPYQSKNVEQQNQDKSGEELGPDKAKERDGPLGPSTRPELEPGELQQQDSLAGCTEDHEKLDDREAAGSAFGDTGGARVAVSSPVSSHQSYMQYQHAYSYLQMCDPSSSAYRVMSPALMQSYPGFHYPLYGKTAGRDESEVAPSGRGASGKSQCESVALELLQHHKLPFHAQSPTPGERESPKRERALERERDHAPFARHLHTHHHTHLGVGYPLIPGQYDHYQALGASGLTSAAVVSSQQVAAQTSAAGNDGKI